MKTFNDYLNEGLGNRMLNSNFVEFILEFLDLENKTFSHKKYGEIKVKGIYFKGLSASSRYILFIPSDKKFLNREIEEYPVEFFKNITNYAQMIGSVFQTIAKYLPVKNDIEI